MELWTGDLTSLSILSKTRGTAHRQPHEAGKDWAHIQFFVEALTSLPHAFPAFSAPLLVLLPAMSGCLQVTEPALNPVELRLGNTFVTV